METFALLCGALLSVVLCRVALLFLPLLVFLLLFVAGLVLLVLVVLLWALGTKQNDVQKCAMCMTPLEALRISHQENAASADHANKRKLDNGIGYLPDEEIS